MIICTNHFTLESYNLVFRVLGKDIFFTTNFLKLSLKFKIFVSSIFFIFICCIKCSLKYPNMVVEFLHAICSISGQVIIRFRNTNYRAERLFISNPREMFSKEGIIDRNIDKESINTFTDIFN